MTKEQIERLRAQTLWVPNPSEDHLLDALPRLLEERQRLLEALRAAYDSPLAFDADDVQAQTVAAIAFAEEEAK